GNLSSLDRLLQELYGEEHENLLPKFIPKTIPYPGPPKHSTSGLQKRNTNLDFLGRFNQEDIRAILGGIAKYNRGRYEVDEVAGQSLLNRSGLPVWAPYRDADRVEFDRIIQQCEQDWFLEGVIDYRIRNRIVTMKLFYDTWDMNKLYRHIQAGDFSPPPDVVLQQSEMAVITMAIRKHRKAGDRYRQIVDKCLDDWKATYASQRLSKGIANAERVEALVVELYVQVFERRPSEAEVKKNAKQFQLYLSRLDSQKAVEKLIESLILSTEFAYRHEFGQGASDHEGRRMLSPRDASYALAYALTDSSPDEQLLNAVDGGRLETRGDYEREIRRMLERRDQWCIIDEGVQAANLNASVTNQPIRKLRFFREFFGYPKAQDVFKDDSRFGAGRHQQAVSRLIDEADLLVEHILEEDKQVFEKLLTTEKFFVYHSGDNRAM
ncbi:MAG: DUF1592 domain-containing protein, partial [Planctomycetota bacterium]|nr:DUF1592 domain-containing protein [Planctomycetota bacterium]